MKGLVKSPTSPITTMSDERIEALSRNHPVLPIALSKDGSASSQTMRDFLCHELNTGLHRVPFTLAEFYGDYVNFVLISHLRANRFNYAPKHYHWNIRDALDRLAKAAFLHTVKGSKITEGSLNKLLGDLQGKENNVSEDGKDLDFRAFGLFDQEDVNKKTYVFRESMIEEYLVAHYHFMECLRKVTAGKLDKVVTTAMRDSMRKLPATGDIWRMTFGLLNSDANLRSVQAIILKALIEEAKKKNNMTPFEITTLCTEAIYESQNAGELAELLDEFTLNQTVNFSNAIIGPARHPYTISAVGYLVRASPNVYGLHLAKFGLNGENVSLLADPVNAVSDNNLQVMNMSYNNLGPNGMRRLQRFIVKASLLTHVDLSHCMLGNVGAALLSEFFMCLPLRYLRLSNNSIGDKGLIHMVPNLKYAPTLEWFDLSGNLLTDKSVIRLGDALPVLHNLRNLDLQRNKIGDQGADAISRQLSKLNRVTHLMLAENLIGRFGATSLAGHCWTTKSLRHVNLSLNNIPAEGILNLRKAAYDHGTLQIQVAGQEAGDADTSQCGEAVLSAEGVPPSSPDELSLSMNLLTGLKLEDEQKVVLRKKPSRRASMPRFSNFRQSWHAGKSYSFHEDITRSTPNVRGSLRDTGRRLEMP